MQGNLGPFLGVTTDFHSAFAFTWSGFHLLNLIFASAVASALLSAVSFAWDLSSATTAFSITILQNELSVRLPSANLCTLP